MFLVEQNSVLFFKKRENGKFFASEMYLDKFFRTHLWKKQSAKEQSSTMSRLRWRTIFQQRKTSPRKRQQMVDTDKSLIKKIIVKIYFLLNYHPFRFRNEITNKIDRARYIWKCVKLHKLNIMKATELREAGFLWSLCGSDFSFINVFYPVIQVFIQIGYQILLILQIVKILKK